MTEVIRIPKTGDVIGGKYELQEEIGRGGFGIVFRARQLGVERFVAVKMLLPHAMTHEGVSERFKREARLASKLKHANSVQIYDYGVHHEGDKETVQGLPFIAMEYLEGETLQSYLIRHRRLKLEDARDILDQALSSLGEAHRLGIVHRDLKPENIFLCNRNRSSRVVKVLDFGIAKAVTGNWDEETRERLTRTGLVAGTAEYMAPEQASGQKNITPAVDVYAMGCIAFQMLTGHIPYDGNSPMDIAIKHISDPIPELPQGYGDHPVRHVIKRSMAKQAQERYEDATHFQQILATMEDIPLETLLSFDDSVSLNLNHRAGGDTALFDPNEPPTLPVDELYEEGDATQIYATAYPSDTSEDMALLDSDIYDPYERPRRRSTTVITVLAILFLLFGVVITGALAYQLLRDMEQDTNTAVMAAQQQARPKPPLVKEDPPGLASSVVLLTQPSATIFKGDVKIKDTPHVLQRNHGETAPVQLVLKREGYEPLPITIDWAKVDTSDNILEFKLKALPDEEALANKELPTPEPVQAQPPEEDPEEDSASARNSRKGNRKGNRKTPPKKAVGGKATPKDSGQSGAAGKDDSQGKTKSPILFNPNSGKDSKPLFTP